MPWLIAIRSLLGGVGAAFRRFFGSLSLQGWVGLAASLCLAWVALHQWGEARHWRKQSNQYQRLYADEKTALETTKANLVAAANKAKADDAANVQRVKAEQSAISERTANDFEARIADARARAGRLQREAAAHPGVRSGADVPGIPAAPSGTAQASGENGLSPSDQLTATEQAIQLDELEKWVRAQANVDPNKGKPHG